jgi:uncharacterized protein (UPF0332 family)
MTLNEEEKKILIRHKLSKSRGTEREARLLLDNNMLSAAVNRIYYSMYYALSALALKYGFRSSKHGRLIGWFNKTFVKEKVVEIRYAKILTIAFEKRMDGDYEDFIEFDVSEVANMLTELNDFLHRIENLIIE